MPNIFVQVVQHLRPGGIESLSLDLLDRLDDQARTYIVSLEGKAEDAIASWPRLGKHRDRLFFLEKQKGVEPALVARLWALFRKLKPTAVQTHHIGPLLYGGLAARLAGVPRVVHTEHDAWHLEDKSERRLQRLLVRLVQPTMVAVSPIVARAVRRFVPGYPTRVVTNGVDTDRFRPADRMKARRSLGLPLHATLVGCAARLEKVKGVDVLIDASFHLPPDVHLAIAGVGSEHKALADQVRELMLEGRVHFLGRVDDMPSFYQSLNLFCQPSRAEGLPLAVLEAQACGIPVVATQVGGMEEALCPKTGRLVQPENPRMLGRTIMKALQIKAPLSPRDFVLMNRDVRSMAKAYEALASA